MTQPQTPPGWRHAEGDPPGTERYWDGHAWQGEPRPRGGAPVSAPVERQASKARAGFTANDARGFFSRLFDLSFQSFITTSIIKVLYILLIIGAGLVALLFIGAGFAADTGIGVVMLIVSPLIFLIYVILGRVYLELVIVLFRIHDQTAETAKNTRQ